MAVHSRALVSVFGRCWRSALVVLSFGALGACSVYDASLLRSDLQAGGAAGADPSGSDGGGTSTAGGTDSSGGDSASAQGGAAAGPAIGSAGERGAPDGGTGSVAADGGKNAGGTSPGGSNAGGTGAAGTGATSAGGTSAGGASAGATSTGGTSIGGTSGTGSSTGGAAPDLAAGKSVTASTEQVGNEAVRGNDGDLTTRWCANHGTMPQWWRVDLGAVHALSRFSVQFEYPDRLYTYQISSSLDDLTYALNISLSGTGAVQSAPFPAGVSARYVRITVTAAAPPDSTHSTFASFWDFSVTGT